MVKKIIGTSLFLLLPLLCCQSQYSLVQYTDFPNNHIVQHASIDNYSPFQPQRSLLWPRIGQAGGLVMGGLGIYMLTYGLTYSATAAGGFFIYRLIGTDPDGSLKSWAENGTVLIISGIVFTTGGIYLVVKSTKKANSVRRWNNAVNKGVSSISLSPAILSSGLRGDYIPGISARISF